MAVAPNDNSEVLRIQKEIAFLKAEQDKTLMNVSLDRAKERDITIAVGALTGFIKAINEKNRAKESLILESGGTLPMRTRRGGDLQYAEVTLSKAYQHLENIRNNKNRDLIALNKANKKVREAFTKYHSLRRPLIEKAQSDRYKQHVKECMKLSTDVSNLLPRAVSVKDIEAGFTMLENVEADIDSSYQSAHLSEEGYQSLMTQIGKLHDLIENSRSQLVKQEKVEASSSSNQSSSASVIDVDVLAAKNSIALIKNAMRSIPKDTHFYRMSEGRLAEAEEHLQDLMVVRGVTSSQDAQAGNPEQLWKKAQGTHERMLRLEFSEPGSRQYEAAAHAHVKALQDALKSEPEGGKSRYRESYEQAIRLGPAKEQGAKDIYVRAHQCLLEAKADHKKSGFLSKKWLKTKKVMDESKKIIRQIEKKHKGESWLKTLKVELAQEKKSGRPSFGGTKVRSHQSLRAKGGQGAEVGSPRVDGANLNPQGVDPSRPDDDCSPGASNSGGIGL